MPRIIDVIDHVNIMDDELAYREPQQGSGDWRMGSQVIVGESQAAVFVRAGQALDALGPGRHTLSTANLPILSGLIGLATSGRTPFTADLYFVNLKDLPQVGWGTNPPIVLETPGKGLGVALLVTHGVIDIGVDDTMRFVKQYAVGKPVLRLNDIKERIQSMLLGTISSLLCNQARRASPMPTASSKTSKARRWRSSMTNSLPLACVLKPSNPSRLPLSRFLRTNCAITSVSTCGNA